MTRFLDGPAAGQSLTLNRAPRFLRAVQKPSGAWDALDQLEDSPEDDERIYVYRRMAKPSVLHVDSTKGSAWYMVAEYRLNPTQPAEYQARDNFEWQGWCLAETGKTR
jgi:hypothetical protein